MHVSSNVAGRYIRAALVTAAAVALTGLSGCDSSDDTASLIRATVAVQSITQQGQCEDVNVKVTPVQILPGAPKLSNSKEFVTPVKLTKGADGVSCTGSSQTIPMAPGKWKFTANMPSEIASCERDIAAAGPLNVSFKDGETTCS
ncbi:MAG: hypothetical protein JSR73_15790 [Proteobacteria bacterium]|nr:hypothetical protein [Pseudomonadota bacterium]